MSDQQIHEELERSLFTLSSECKRGIVGERTFHGIPIAGYARVAPNCIVYCQPLIPERDIFLDFCLN